MSQRSGWLREEMLQVGEEVRTALAEGRPVVALESTVIAHGLPYPENVTAALRIEDAVRAGGAVPATIGIADGRFVVGMSQQEIEQFASSPGIPKVSSRDIGIVLAGGGLGATTVASTIVAADAAGIPFFSTAGIGGVHRGASVTLDISADLTQFTRSRVAVVCAGCKSILDIGLTLEYLETLGVPIIAKDCDFFPAFYSISSGCRSPHRIDDPDRIARAIQMHWDLGMSGSVLVTSPIRPPDAIDGDEIEQVIQEALRAADHDGVSGPAITPYLMKRVAKATEGRSARANMAVLISTAELSGQLASAHARLMRERSAVGEVL